MYIAGIMNHFFDAPKMELIVWGSTMGIFAFSAFRFRTQFKIASRTIGTFFYVCSPAVRLLAPPNVFGIDRVTAGRAVGLLAVLAGVVLTQTALKTLGDQYNSVGIREKPRIVDDGPFAYVRHPIYSGSLMAGASLALALWSYIPLYLLPVQIGLLLLKMSIEERTIVEDPEIGDQYERYKVRVPYRIIPYIW